MRGVAGYQGPACPHCRAPLDLDGVLAGSQECPSCLRRFEAVRFQPVLRRALVAEVGVEGPEEAASCAAHRRNVAVASCERCGIFMCTLCRTESDGMTICAPCFERLAAQGSLHSASTEYRNYIGMAWLCVLAGVVSCFAPLLVTGPAAIYCALRAMRQTREWGDVGGRGRAVAALAAGVVSTITGGLVVAALLS